MKLKLEGWVSGRELLTDEQCLTVFAELGVEVKDQYGSLQCAGMRAVVLWIEANRFKAGAFTEGFSTHTFHATTRNLALNAALFFFRTGDWE